MKWQTNSHWWNFKLLMVLGKKRHNMTLVKKNGFFLLCVFDAWDAQELSALMQPLKQVCRSP